MHYYIQWLKKLTLSHKSGTDSDYTKISNIFEFRQANSFCACKIYVYQITCIVKKYPKPKILNTVFFLSPSFAKQKVVILIYLKITSPGRMTLCING
jgi:hypothetical protein